MPPDSTTAAVEVMMLNNHSSGRVVKIRTSCKSKHCFYSLLREKQKVKSQMSSSVTYKPVKQSGGTCYAHAATRIMLHTCVASHHLCAHAHTYEALVNLIINKYGMDGGISYDVIAYYGNPVPLSHSQTMYQPMPSSAVPRSPKLLTHGVTTPSSRRFPAPP